jgi:hypothetical protein
MSLAGQEREKLYHLLTVWGLGEFCRSCFTGLVSFAAVVLPGLGEFCRSCFTGCAVHFRVLAMPNFSITEKPSPEPLFRRSRIRRVS